MLEVKAGEFYSKIELKFPTPVRINFSDVFFLEVISDLFNKNYVYL